MYCREQKDVRARNSVETTVTDSHIGTLVPGYPPSQMVLYTGSLD